MSSSDLFSSSEPPSEARPIISKKLRFPPWLLPVFLLAAFGAIFVAFFIDRILPAKRVVATPAILLADIEGDAADSPAPQPGAEAVGGADSAPDYTAPMLFQAAGWFEPDPLPIRATALLDGVVAEVHVLEGEIVKRGQPLANLIPEDAELQLAASKRAEEQVVAEHHQHLAHIPAVKAEAAGVLDQIAAAQASLEELSDRYSRIQSLSPGTVSDQEATASRLAVDSQTAKIAALRSERLATLARLEAINTQSAVFDARIAAAKVTIAESELALSRTEIVSPVDGVVLELKAAPGQKKLLRMDDPDSATIAVLFETGKLQARVDVPLADARGLAPGQAAIITSDFLPNAEFEGIVTRIVGSADLQRNTLQAKVRVIDPNPRLRPEMLCRVKFLEAGAGRDQQGNARPGDTGSRRMVMVPQDALFARDGQRASVWVASPEGSRALSKQVELGRVEKDGHIAITAGLLAGERVILPPHSGLEDGRRIQVSTDTP